MDYKLLSRLPSLATAGSWLAAGEKEVAWPVDGRMKHTTTVFQVKLAQLMWVMFSIL